MREEPLVNSTIAPGVRDSTELPVNPTKTVVLPVVLDTRPVLLSQVIVSEAVGAVSRVRVCSVPSFSFNVTVVSADSVRFNTNGAGASP